MFSPPQWYGNYGLVYSSGSSDARCTPSAYGPLCTLCAIGTYREDGLCLACEDPSIDYDVGVPPQLIILLVVLLVCVCGCVGRLVYKKMKKKKEKKEEEPAWPKLKIETWTVTGITLDEDRPASGLTVEDNRFGDVLISQVAEDSPASKQGMRPRLRLISVDGVTLRALVFDGVRAEELVDDTSLNKRTYG